MISIQQSEYAKLKGSMKKLFRWLLKHELATLIPDAGPVLPEPIPVPVPNESFPVALTQIHSAEKDWKISSLSEHLGDLFHVEYYSINPNRNRLFFYRNLRRLNTKAFTGETASIPLQLGNELWYAREGDTPLVYDMIKDTFKMLSFKLGFSSCVCLFNGEPAFATISRGEKFAKLLNKNGQLIRELPIGGIPCCSYLDVFKSISYIGSADGENTGSVILTTFTKTHSGDVRCIGFHDLDYLEARDGKLITETGRVALIKGSVGGFATRLASPQNILLVACSTPDAVYAGSAIDRLRLIKEFPADNTGLGSLFDVRITPTHFSRCKNKTGEIYRIEYQ